MELYAKTVEFVDDAFGSKQKTHFERTVYWLEQFLPGCTEAHRIAAYAHDIERAFRDKSVQEPDDYRDIAFLRMHEEGGAEIMKEFLLSAGADKECIETVTHLISRHEEGGDEAQTALMDADSVSFMETNAEIFVTLKVQEEGYDKVKGKLDWMYERISDSERKELATQKYTHWTRDLEKFK